MEEYYLFTFESTHAAISTEKILKPAECTIMPVPRFISSSCGISVRIRPDMREQAESLFASESNLSTDEFKYYHVSIDPVDKQVTCNQIPVKSSN